MKDHRSVKTAGKREIGKWMRGIFCTAAAMFIVCFCLPQAAQAEAPTRFSLSDLMGLAEMLGGESSSSSGNSSPVSGEDKIPGILELFSALTKTEIKDCKVAPIEDQTYTGKEIRPSLKISNGKKTLKRGTDYTLTYSNNIKTGTARVTIKGKGDYTGTKRVSFKIVKKSASKTSDKKKAGSNSKTSNSKTSGSNSKKTESKAKSGTKTSSSKSDSGTKQEGTFTVKLGTETYVYNGSARKPSVTVTLRGKSVPKTSYTVTYKDNTKVGRATVTVKGKGDYKQCSGEKTFRITLKKTALSTASSPAAGQIKAGWNKDGQAEGYQLEFCTNKTFSSKVKSTKVEGSAKQSCLMEGLTSGKAYYVRIRSYKKVGSRNWYSEWSAAKQVKVK